MFRKRKTLRSVNLTIKILHAVSEESVAAAICIHDVTEREVHVGRDCVHVTLDIHLASPEHV